MARIITFDEVEPALRQLFDEVRGELRELPWLIAVRDLFGRVRFLVERRPTSGTSVAAALERLAQAAGDRLGPRVYPLDQAFLYGDELASDPESAVKESRVLVEGPPELRLLDRQVTGQAWDTVSQPRDGAGPRLAFYSLKGGVGRSTAVAVAAWHLAKQGRNVLVFDLDLEAPGLSSSLLPAPRQPEFGLLDWFVEDAVGQGDACLDGMLATSPLADDLPGQVWVVPSHGANAGDYLAKLGRCYLDLPPRDGRGPEPWQQRLVRVIDALEQRQQPDAVLLDVRAGMAELASAAITDLGADVLLFAVDTEQTWSGYRVLFEHWLRAGTIRKLRERLRVVAALVPETDREPYLTGFRERAWDLFRQHAYDIIDPTEGPPADAFSFDLADESAPHAPIPIYWNRGFASMRHLHALDETLAAAAFGRFLAQLDAHFAMDVEDGR